jgi:hypothetical protein
LGDTCEWDLDPVLLILLSNLFPTLEDGLKLYLLEAYKTLFVYLSIVSEEFSSIYMLFGDP